MKLIIGILLLSSFAIADTDMTCLNDCQKKNYNWQFCQEHCSYGNTLAHDHLNYESHSQQQSDSDTSFGKVLDQANHYRH